MTETSDVKETNSSQPSNYLTKKWSWLAALFSLPLLFLFVYLGDQGRGLAAMVGGIAIVTAIRFRWDLRKRVWFWATVTVLVLAHVPLILLVKWPNVSMPPVSLMPYGVLDFAIMYGCIKLVEKAMTRG
jgi:hypothetical protein